MTSKLPNVNICPVCKYEMNAATLLQDGKSERGQPIAGDITLCLKCGEVACFDEELNLREAQISDLITLDATAKAMLDKAQRIIRQKRFLG